MCIDINNHLCYNYRRSCYGLAFPRKVDTEEKNMKVLKTPKQKLLDEKIAAGLPFTAIVGCEQQYYWSSDPESTCGAVLEIEEGDIHWNRYDNGPYCNSERDTGIVHYAHCAHCGNPIILGDSSGHGVKPLIPNWLKSKITESRPMSEYPRNMWRN